jgi:hypothetical protein
VLAVVVPEAERFAVLPEGAVASDLHTIYAMQERRRVREARRTLARHGVPLITCDRDEAKSIVVRRARTAARAA